MYKRDIYRKLNKGENLDIVLGLLGVENVEKYRNLVNDYLKDLSDRIKNYTNKEEVKARRAEWLKENSERLKKSRHDYYISHRLRKETSTNDTEI